MIVLCSTTKGDSIHLAPEEISLQLVVGMLLCYQKCVFTSVILSCYGKIHCIIAVTGNEQRMDPEET